MPLVTEHLRRNVQFAADSPHPLAWETVDHLWTMDLVFSMSALIEEDGGPEKAYGTGYGVLRRRLLVDHTFTNDYSLPGDEEPIRKGDRIRMWRE